RTFNNVREMSALNLHCSSRCPFRVKSRYLQGEEAGLRLPKQHAQECVAAMPSRSALIKLLILLVTLGSFDVGSNSADQMTVLVPSSLSATDSTPVANRNCHRHEPAAPLPVQCPLRVIGGHFIAPTPCPLYLRKRT